MKPLIEFTKLGLYCPQADIYIDPWRPVNKAIVTHAHSDHARWGMKHYLAHEQSETILRLRLGKDISLETLPYGQSISLNGVKFSLHPAGHIYGSAQVRAEYKGQIWVVSGDYKLEDDGFSGVFEPVKCHSFVTESTFGLPIYTWKPQPQVMDEIHEWWRHNQAQQKASLLIAYALGKSQRIIHQLDRSIGPVYLHGAVANVNDALIAGGAILPNLPRVTSEIPKDQLRKALIVAPSSALNSPWVNRFRPYSTGIASGWMMVRGAKRRRAADRGFVLSDHADWPGLNETVRATEAEQIYVTHGFTSVFRRWLQEQGKEAYEVETLYEGETADMEDQIGNGETEDQKK
uniref:Ligase-associated DNA damage response exonuclease n=1 Tax=Roseihalotalea indica TaxID=2867963 RepID=A0AA49GSA4_9BACT|nr:ligase-associated DNA damage response exonuclease [Tunicatimonas sp. TK19036]